MAPQISKRQRRLLTNASVRDKWRILRNPQLWTAAHLKLLIRRIDELAEDDPQQSFQLGSEVLPPIFERAGRDLPPDTMALGYAALGQASRRLGRLRRADEFYDRAWRLRSLERATWTKLHRRRAILALDSLDFPRAEKLADQAIRLATTPTEQAQGFIARGIIDIVREDFGPAGRFLREALKVCPSDSDLQFVALGNLLDVSMRSGDHDELATTGASIVSLRRRLRGSRSRRSRKLIAHLNWIEGKLFLKLGLSGQVVPRRLRQAALSLVRLQLIGDALLCTADLLAFAQEHGQTKGVLTICQEVVALANDLEADSHFETRRLLEQIIAEHQVEGELLAAFHLALQTAA